VISFHPDRIDGVDSDFVGVLPFDKYRNKRLFLTRLFHVRRIIRGFRPDLVFAPYLVSNGLVGALAWKGPLLVSGRGGDLLQHPDHSLWRRGIHGTTVRFVCRRAGLVHVVAPHLEAVLRGMGVPAGKLVCFPLGVDLNAFHPTTETPRRGATRLICTRNHAPVYDIPTLIEALVRLRDDGTEFHCTFAGGGHLLEAHRRRAEEAGLADRVEFTGSLPHEKLPGLLATADVYVSPALSDGASSSLFEAMATGLLPVVTRIEANTAWIRHGENGLLFQSGEASDLASCLRRAMGDGALREGALRENRRLIEAEGDMRRNMGRMEDLFERVLSGYSGT